MVALGLIIFLMACHQVSAGGWRILSPGVAYKDLDRNPINLWRHIHVFKINLQENQLELVTAKDMKKINASSQELGQFAHALISVNGGFFSQNFQPLGLRVSNNIQKNPLKSISWWGVFFTKNNKAYIHSVKQFQSSKAINFAVQSGPRLIVKGQIPKFKPGIAERTALGINQRGEIILLVTEGAPLAMNDLALLLKSPPLSCTDALNLDGGSSTQLFADINGFEINSRGFSNVTDAVVIVPKHKNESSIFTNH